MFITIEKVLVLKQFDFLKNVSNMALSDLMAVSEEVTLSPGDMLLEENTPNQNLYFCLSGTLIHTRQGVTEELSGKNIIGLDTVFLTEAIQESIKVKRNGTALRISKDKLYRTMALHPSLAMAILNELSLLAYKKTVDFLKK